MKSRLFKLALVMSFMFLSYPNAIAQEFTINVHDTNILDSLGSEIIFAIDLTNNSSQDMGVSIVRKKNDIFENWSSSLCFDNCFIPSTDSISTSSYFGSSPLTPGETREISLHVFPSVNEGVGYISLELTNEENTSEKYSVDFEASTILVSVKDEISKISDYKLSQNYPNPFNPATIINYSIGSKNGSTEFVSLKVFDVLGREVATLVNQHQNVGSYSVEFNSTKLTSGVYFYELRTDNFHQINKMILEK